LIIYLKFASKFAKELFLKTLKNFLERAKKDFLTFLRTGDYQAEKKYCTV